MKKIATLLAFAGALILQTADAQKPLDANHVKQLVLNNASALGFTKADVENSRIANAFYEKRSNLIMAYLQQTYKGVDVSNAITSMTFKNDQLIASQSSRLKDIEEVEKTASAKASITPIAALQTVIRDLELPVTQPVINAVKISADGQEFEYDKMNVALNNITVRKVWTKTDNDFRLTWQVSLISNKDNGSYIIKVDALTGRIINKQNLTSYCNWTLPADKHAALHKNAAASGSQLHP